MNAVVKSVDRIISRIQILEANIVDPDEAAHYELPHLDLYCLQIHLLSFSAL